ncbi:MAG: thioester reductase, partial [Mycobacteriaceae bacterium]|nr:thioester reductase [Mycobacteriaceae bacterium]
MTLETPAARARTAGDRGIPLSPAQQAALAPERLGRSAAANLFTALEFPAACAPSVVERAAVLSARHEILRTVYPDDRRAPYGRVESDSTVAVEVVEIGETGLAAAIMADAGHRFDTVRQPPIRLRLYRLGAKAVLSVALHPVAGDDRSLELLVAELFSDAPAVSVRQYREFAAEQTKQLAAAGESLAYWTQRLTGLPEQLLRAGERPES